MALKRTSQRAKRTVNRSKAVRKIEAMEAVVPVLAADTENSFNLPKVPSVLKKAANPLVLFGLVIIVLLAALVWKNKSWFIAGTVNGRPITRLELDSRMTQRYGQQTLDELINEKLLQDAAAKKGITATNADIDAKEQQIRNQLGTQVTLEQALSQQGMTLVEFRQQLRLQVLVEKLVADQIQITDSEITEYIASNSATLTATDEAKQKEEAKTILTQQKTNEAFSKYFSDLKAKSSIVKFL